MPSDSIVDAALSGFRLVRERPRTIAVWAGVHLVFTLGIGLAMVLTGGAALAQLTAASATSRTDPSQTLALLGQVAPMYLLLLVAFALYYAVFMAAVNRALMQPDDARFGYLKVGVDELRQLGLNILLLLVMIGVYIALIVVAILIGVTISLIGAALGGFHGPSPSAGGNMIYGILTALLAFLVVGAGLIFVGVRLSLASPLTFAKKHIDLFGSWRLTRGRFWPIFGAYVLSWILVFIVYIIGYALIVAVSAAVGGASGTSLLFRPDLSSVRAYFTLTRFIVIVLQAALSALVLPVTLCPATEIYQRISGPSAVAAVFS